MSDWTDDYTEDAVSIPDGIKVILPSGSQWSVLTEDEKEYIVNKSKEYQEHNKFTNISDLQDLDKVIILEMFTWRWSQWLSLEADYDGDEMLDPKLHENVLKSTKEIGALKKNIGIDKASRDKESGESVAQYIENLGQRAKAFGVMRDQQTEKAVTLWRQAQSLVVLHDNCTEEERKDQGVTPEAIVDWFRRVIPEFDAIDEHFRETNQKTWIRDQ